MKLFDLDGPLMSALSKLADIVICNILFCLFCIPIFTIGASLTALYTCMQQLVGDTDRDDGLMIRAFWRAFTGNFGQATLLWLICLAAFAFFFGYYWVVFYLAGAVGVVYRITFFLLLFAFLFGFQYIFPLQARYRNKLRHTLRNAWLLSVAALPWTLMSIALVLAAIYVSFFLNPSAYGMAIYVWAVCGFGLVTYLNSFFFRRAFRKITPEMEHPETAQSEGAVFLDEEHRRDELMTAESSFSNPDWNRREEPKPKPGSKRKKRR